MRTRIISVYVTLILLSIPAATSAALRCGAGCRHSVVILPDGTLWKMQGANSALTNRASPSQVGTETSWVVVTAGTSHALGIKGDGSLWAWGDNGFGQLGDGTAIGIRTTPVQVGSECTWAGVWAGAYHTLALKTNGT